MGCDYYVDEDCTIDIIVTDYDTGEELFRDSCKVKQGQRLQLEFWGDGLRER